MGESTYNHLFCDVKLFLNAEGQCVVETPSISLRDLLKNSYSSVFYKVLSPYNIHGVIFTTSASTLTSSPPQYSSGSDTFSPEISTQPASLEKNLDHSSPHITPPSFPSSSSSDTPPLTHASSSSLLHTAPKEHTYSASSAMSPQNPAALQDSSSMQARASFSSVDPRMHDTPRSTKVLDPNLLAQNCTPLAEVSPNTDGTHPINVISTTSPSADSTSTAAPLFSPIPHSTDDVASSPDITPPFPAQGLFPHRQTPASSPQSAPSLESLSSLPESSGASIGSPVNQKFTFETFVVGKPNEFAYAAAQRVADSLIPPFNPLFLYGHVGLGKTHLMHAMAHRIQHNDPTRRVVYLSAEKFMYEFIQAIRQKDMVSFKNLFRSVDVLMVDDVQFISGKDSTQEEFFHTFNALVDQDRQVIISADKPPSELAGIEDRIRSRLGRGLAADLHPTTYELRLGILQSKAEQASHSIGLPILEFLAHRITSNVRELEGALTRLMVHSNFSGTKLSLDTAKDVLHDLLRSYDRCVTIEDIQKRTAEYYHLRVQDLSSAKRLRPIVRPRQVAMFLCKELTPSSLPDIGRAFGGRDHTTVLHAIQKIQDLMQSDPQWGEDIETLRRSLKHVS